MRLTAREITAVLACAARFFGPGSVVRLFGSRVDDRRRGGDIDFHVVAESPDLATLTNEIGFSLALQDLIGEQRIDVVARAPGFEPLPIDQVALDTGVVVG